VRVRDMGDSSDGWSSDGESMADPALIRVPLAHIYKVSDSAVDVGNGTIAVVGSFVQIWGASGGQLCSTAINTYVPRGSEGGAVTSNGQEWFFEFENAELAVRFARLVVTSMPCPASLEMLVGEGELANGFVDILYACYFPDSDVPCAQRLDPKRPVRTLIDSQVQNPSAMLDGMRLGGRRLFSVASLPPGHDFVGLEDVPTNKKVLLDVIAMRLTKVKKAPRTLATDLSNGHISGTSTPGTPGTPSTPRTKSRRAKDRDKEKRTKDRDADDHHERGQERKAKDRHGDGKSGKCGSTDVWIQLEAAVAALSEAHADGVRRQSLRCSKRLLSAVKDNAIRKLGGPEVADPAVVSAVQEAIAEGVSDLTAGVSEATDDMLAGPAWVAAMMLCQQSLRNARAGAPSAPSPRADKTLQGGARGESGERLELMVQELSDNLASAQAREQKLMADLAVARSGPASVSATQASDPPEHGPSSPRSLLGGELTELSGWLRKRGASTFGFRFQPRWFSFSADGEYLCYQESKGAGKKGSICLAAVSQIEPEHPAADAWDFVVVTNTFGGKKGKAYRCRTDSEQEQLQWIRAIRDAMDKLPP